MLPNKRALQPLPFYNKLCLGPFPAKMTSCRRGTVFGVMKDNAGPLPKTWNGAVKVYGLENRVEEEPIFQLEESEEEEDYEDMLGIIEDPVMVFSYPHILQQLAEAGYEAKSIDFQNPAFQVKVFLSFVHKQTTGGDLGRGRGNLVQTMKRTELELRLLVRDNFARFIECKDIIDKSYLELRAHEENELVVGVKQLDIMYCEGLDRIKGCFTPLIDRKYEKVKVEGILQVLRRYKFIFVIPGKLQELKRLGKLDQAVVLYKRSRDMMASLDVPIFTQVWRQIEIIKDEIVGMCSAKLEDPYCRWREHEKMLELLKELKGDDTSRVRYFSHILQWLKQMLQHYFKEGNLLYTQSIPPDVPSSDFHGQLASSLIHICKRLSEVVEIYFPAGYHQMEVIIARKVLEVQQISLLQRSMMGLIDVYVQVVNTLLLGNKEGYYPLPSDTMRYIQGKVVTIMKGCCSKLMEEGVPGEAISAIQQLVAIVSKRQMISMVEVCLLSCSTMYTYPADDISALLQHFGRMLHQVIDEMQTILAEEDLLQIAGNAVEDAVRRMMDSIYQLSRSDVFPLLTLIDGCQTLQHTMLGSIAEKCTQYHIPFHIPPLASLMNELISILTLRYVRTKSANLIRLGADAVLAWTKGTPPMKDDISLPTLEALTQIVALQAELDESQVNTHWVLERCVELYVVSLRMHSDKTVRKGRTVELFYIRTILHRFLSPYAIKVLERMGGKPMKEMQESSYDDLFSARALLFSSLRSNPMPVPPRKLLSMEAFRMQQVGGI